VCRAYLSGMGSAHCQGSWAFSLPSGWVIAVAFPYLSRSSDSRGLPQGAGLLLGVLAALFGSVPSGPANTSAASIVDL